MKDWSKHKPTIFTYQGKYIKNWFSNMESSLIDDGSITYPTVEHFYQSSKSGSFIEAILIAKAETPQEAKRMGRSVSKPFEYLLANKSINEIFADKIKDKVDGSGDLNDIEKIKITIMYVGLFLKFSIPEWKEKLLKTGDDVIIEWNNWNDTFWGVNVDTNKGHNWLGKLLMLVRQDI